ncbi:acyltransferase [Solihabitans fulvus]|uniref:Acyltransferase n=1 Tax=Solihabitans fulvus TaxID=1892852 RepID=A0A5B2XDR5_9PSEU|nr:acyltransferase [Solihabitans fulvus]KAA2261179.1 acyltransferase [Solihabitans fulvus]
MTATTPPRAPSDNAFDLLRLVGALLVIAEHSWVLAGHDTPLGRASGSGFGSIGVGIFFLTSGYLISASWLADPSVRRYAARRALRIYPAYLVVVAGTALVLGPLLTTLSARAYFTNSGTWSYLARNLLVYPVSYALPGVFEHAPQPGVVNGSLWTIRVEVLCYLGVAALGLFRLLRRRSVLVTLAAAGLAVATVVHVTGYGGLLYPLPVAADAAEPLAFFAIGAAARWFGPRVAPPWWLAALSVLAWLVAWGTPVANLLSIVAVSCVTFTVAFRSPTVLHHPLRGWDLSYGTYLLAFPVQQVLVQLGVRAPALLLLATTAVALPLAAVSWRLLERPALRLKPRRPTVDPARSLGQTGTGGR